MIRRLWLSACCALGGAFVACSVQAADSLQEATETPNAKERSEVLPGTIVSPGSQPDGGPSLVVPPPGDFNGPLSDLGNKLEQNGIEFSLTFLNFYQNAPNFGFVGGSEANYGLLLFDAKYHFTDDLRINIIEVVNAPVKNADGYFFDISNAFFPAPVVDSDTDLMRLTLSADLLDDRLVVEAGRLGLGRDFMKAGFCGGLGCLNSTKAITLELPGESLAVWGMQASYSLDPMRKLNFGVIEDNPDNWQTGDGWDWGHGDSRGYIAMASLTQRQTFIDSPEPLNYEIGAWHASRTYEDALFANGFGNPTFPATQVETHDGLSGIWAQGRKVVWSDPAAGPGLPEHIAVYGGVFHTFGEGVAYPWEAYAGIEYGGFLKSNPLTTVGASVRYIGLSQERAAYERNARLFFTGGAVDQAQPQDTFLFDLHASTALGPNAILEVGAAYMINPNTSVLADFSTERLGDGALFYVNLIVDISGALGLSRPRAP